MSEVLIPSKTFRPSSTSTSPIFSSRVWSKTCTPQPCSATASGTVSRMALSGATGRTGGRVS